MKYAKLILAISVLLNCSNAKTVTINSKEISGYYWRDYVGEIPSDAVPGGTVNEGQATYIGQTVHPGASILPGFINTAKKMMFYEHTGAEHSATEDVKIVCSQQAEKLRWVSTKSGEPIANIGKDNQLILGGHDYSRPLAIGRKSIETGDSTLGKVLIVDHNFESIYLPNSGVGLSDNGPYEVLVYNNLTVITEQNQNKCVGQTINININ